MPCGRWWHAELTISHGTQRFLHVLTWDILVVYQNTAHDKRRHTYRFNLSTEYAITAPKLGSSTIYHINKLCCRTTEQPDYKQAWLRGQWFNHLSFWESRCHWLFESWNLKPRHRQSSNGATMLHSSQSTSILTVGQHPPG